MKSCKLLFSQARAARLPSGKQLPPVTIVRVDGDQHRWSRADRDSYSGVRAMHISIKTGNRSAVVAGIGGRAKELRTTFASREDALAAARAEWLRIQRGIFAFEITLAYAARTSHRNGPCASLATSRRSTRRFGSSPACAIRSTAAAT